MDISGTAPSLFGFATAEFEDADAGSGTTLRNIQSAVENALQFHMNVASTIVPDARDFLRPWRKRLRDILGNEIEMLTMFLEKPLEDTSIVQRHSHFIHALESDPFNSNASWLKDKLEPIIVNDDILNELSTEIGTPLKTIETEIHKVMNIYLETLQEMFRSVHVLTLKIDKVEKLKTRLLGIPIEDGETEEILNLKQSVMTYIRSEYERNNIQAEYKSFCKHYARFMALRSVITAISVSTNSADGPMCSICTTERVCWALVPCGHTFCNTCTQKQRSQCFVCRTTLRDRQRLYFI
jgi:hypothetical protein